MLKSPKQRKKRNVRRNVYKGQSEHSIKVIKSYNKMYKAYLEMFQDYAIGFTNEVFIQSFNSLYISSYHNSNIFLFLSAYEKSYGYLIKTYRDIIHIYEKVGTNIEDGHISSIMQGMSDVLASRCDDYKEENCIAENAINLNASEIFKSYIASSMDIIKPVFPGIIKSIYASLDRSIWDINNENIEMSFEEIGKRILLEFSEPVYKIYCEGIEKSLSEIDKNLYSDDLDNKLSLIKQEYAILSSIIKIQIPELEASKGNIEAIENMLSLAKEAYQHLGKSIEYMENKYSSRLDKRDEEICLPSFEDFNVIIADSVHSDYQFDKQVHLENIKMIKEELETDINDGILRYIRIIEKENQGECLEELKEEFVDENKSIADFMILSFNSLAPYFSENKESLLSCEEINIIEGINETVSIKTEGIKEGFDYYLENINNIDASENAVLNDDFIKEIRGLVLDYLKNNHKGYMEQNYQEITALNRFFSETTKENSREALYKYNKLLEEKKDKLISLSTGFKRDTLLFEMSTFEEILNYSVEKLMESSDRNVLQYGNYVKKIYSDILNKFVKFNIRQINPSLGDLFNAKEHEVLMAKKEEGFAKGSIIKVLNRGYSQNGQVLLRANIIAAK